MSFIESVGEAPKARRRSSEDVVDRVAVRCAMADLIKSIEVLQNESAFLRVQVSRHSNAQEQFIPRVVALGQSLRAACAKFERVVAGLSERQQGHSRVDDIRRALEALQASVPRLSA